ncbi:hypothetical protein L2719_07905 [Shewanella schlegeliana]|uniref:Uncharacterized protein n=1 Tax=Shewanella schlegeliana TaxID=190308 RepID=A0ABS1T0J1_9GAMM|nr:hypothetical protein [Shewanella schlegeliana]MBL4914311.1 hypothetical protein [Shewanella schlegeliana]MCL1109466.1 hypothetical protein [Shewanella schlegeliana]
MPSAGLERHHAPSLCQSHTPYKLPKVRVATCEHYRKPRLLQQASLLAITKYDDDA